MEKVSYSEISISSRQRYDHRTWHFPHSRIVCPAYPTLPFVSWQEIFSTIRPQRGLYTFRYGRWQGQ